MKRFVLSVFAFATFLLVLLGAWAFLLLQAEWRGWKDSCALPPGCDMVVCCDSQTETGLSSAVLPRLFNASRSGTRLCQWYLRTMDVCAANKGRIKWGVIDVPAVKLWREKPDDAPNFGMARSLAPLHIYHWRQNTVPVASLLADFCRETWGVKSRPLIRHLVGGERYVDSIRGGFAPFADQGLLEHREYVMRRMDAQAAKTVEARAAVRASGICPFASLRWIDAIISVYRSCGAQVVLIQTPVHRYLASRVADACAEADVAIERFAAARGIPVLNYRDMLFPDDEWKDGNHLNERGARRLTARLKTDVERLERERRRAERHSQRCGKESDECQRFQ